MRSLRHDNVANFIGMTLNGEPEIMAVWAYCSRGTIGDVLANDDLVLDDTFVSSMLKDVVNVSCL